ncbi:MAG TPA: TrkA family potassium uptake protein [Bacillota bacterium]
MYVIIAGCGRLGSELARNMSEEGHDVVVIDRAREAFERLGSAFDGITIEGTAIDEDVLRQAGVDRADALAAVAGSDEVNLMVGQVARRHFNLRRVVVRVNNPHLESAYRKFGLLTLRPDKSAVAQVRGLLSSQGLTTLLTLGTGEALLSQVALRADLAGQSLDRLAIPGKCQPAGILRGGRVLLPEPDLRVEPGDALICVVRLDALAAVTAWADVTRDPGEM